jgi:hypothetical protein
MVLAYVWNFFENRSSKKTFLVDTCRCSFSGIVEVGLKSFALLIAIRAFNASKISKSILISAVFIGYLITILTHALATKQTKFATMGLCKIHMLVVSVLVFTSILVNSLAIFLVPICIAMIIFKQSVPLMEDVSGQNY